MEIKKYIEFVAPELQNWKTEIMDITPELQNGKMEMERKKVIKFY